MFSGTGNLSLWLGVFFLGLSLAGIFAIFSIVKNKSVTPENIDKLIDIGKWFMASVALTLSASIVNDGFREREQDIKELAAFDKYTSVVLEADGAEKRRLLCEYFASVSPEGPIRGAWERYKKVIDGHIAEIAAAQAKALELAKKVESGTATASEMDERNRLVEKAATLNQSLAPNINQSDLKPRVYFHIRDETQRSEANKLAIKLESNANVSVPGVQRVDAAPSANELRYFRRSEEQEAKQIASNLSSLGLKVAPKYVTGFESSTRIRLRHYELWIASGGF